MNRSDSAPPSSADPPRALRVLHFVSGGFSGATQVAADLVRASLGRSDLEPLLVLRHKRQTAPARYEALRQQGLPVALVTGTLNLLSIWQLSRICKRFQPDVLVAHGFPEHILGRHAGVLASVPRLIHVEHNARERYSWSRLKQARWLAERTEHIVGVSQGVATHLGELGFAAGKVMAIPNGIELSRFEGADASTADQRQPEIVMCARFSGQKDHLTAIRAMALLRDRGLTQRLLFAGSGKARYLKQAQTLVKQLKLDEQVAFLGQCRDVPKLLMHCRIGLLSTHYEGMPLAMLEYMAAGCAVVATDVVGVKEIIEHDNTGLLVPEGDAPALANALERVLDNDELASRLGQAARAKAVAEHGLPLMRQRYEALLMNSRSDPI
jgi:glycosyltransferase involved in cell wall biosynthesis